jgi:hypothetical protein
MVDAFKCLNKGAHLGLIYAFEELPSSPGRGSERRFQVLTWRDNYPSKPRATSSSWRMRAWFSSLEPSVYQRMTPPSSSYAPAFVGHHKIVASPLD